MKVRRTKYTARYRVCPVQCRAHIDWDNQDVVGNNAGGDTLYSFIMWYVSGPALVIGTNDACIVAMNNDIAVMVALINEYKYC